MKPIFLKILLTGAFCLLLFHCSNAQLIYTDVAPDSIIGSTNGVYHLDLNNDGIADYNINFTTGTVSGNCNGIHHSTAYYVKITPLDSNEVGTDATSPFYPKVLLIDSLIDSAAFTWKNTASQLLAERLWHCVGIGLSSHWLSYYVGHWNNTSNRYLPLRLHVGSQVYYGWVRLSVANGVTKATISDYAYNSSPGQPIISGEPLPIVLNDTSTSTCSNYSFVIPFQVIPNYYNPGNKFIAQLSNNVGSFSNPIVLDSVASITSDTIFATLPSISISGNLYQVRIVSTDPPVTGPPSASFTLISAPPAAAIVRTFPVGLDSVCASHGTLYIVASNAYGLTYKWYFNGSLMSTTTDSVYVLTSGSGNYTVTESNACGTDSMAVPFTLFVSPVMVATLDSFPPVCWTDPPFLLTGGHPSGGYYSGGLAVDSVTGMFDPALAFAGNNIVHYTTADSILTQCQYTATRSIVIINCGTHIKETPNGFFNIYSVGKNIIVQLSKLNSDDGMIAVYDVTGRELKKINISGVRNEIDMSGFIQGIYFVRIQSATLNVNGRVYME